MASEDVEPGAPRSQSHLLVTLNVYDFVKQSDTLTASLLAFAGLGIHHSGLQIDDCEFTFNNNGIVRMPTLRMPLCRLNDSIELGKFWGSRAELDAIVDDLARSEGYRPGAYHVLRRNCNHFSEVRRCLVLGGDACRSERLPSRRRAWRSSRRWARVQLMMKRSRSITTTLCPRCRPSRRASSARRFRRG